jgi:SpoVK/Ycf46/Vps4 family AAA+-type ATPase
LDQLVVTAAHFKAALKLCAPSALRETRVEIPNSKWEDIGGLEEVIPFCDHAYIANRPPGGRGGGLGPPYATE